MHRIEDEELPTGLALRDIGDETTEFELKEGLVLGRYDEDYAIAVLEAKGGVKSHRGSQEIRLFVSASKLRKRSQDGAEYERDIDGGNCARRRSKENNEAESRASHSWSAWAKWAVCGAGQAA